MAENSRDSREKIRSLVREILASVPEAAPDHAAPSVVEHVVVNSLQERSRKAFDRDESAKSLITEDDIRGLPDGARLRISPNAKFTPLASDLIRERQIELINKEARGRSVTVSTVAIAADHGGFETKQKLKPFLAELGLRVQDLGTDSAAAVDYPDFAHAVAEAVALGRVDVGIIIDGAGIGSAITANKVPGVRAAACYTPQLAVNSREHNGANVLTLGSSQNGFDDIKQIVEAWLTSEITEERHKARVSKIDGVQKRYSR